jgi:tetratricopeptide (TPR) repeat protein
VCLFILLLFPAFAGLNATVSGEVSSDRPADFSELEIELHDLGNQNTPPELVPVAQDGRFEVRGMSEGNYLLYVKNRVGATLHREVVHIQTMDRRLFVRIPEPSLGEKPASGVVSLNQLTHKPPKAARKAFEKSVALVNKGDEHGSFLLLQKAVEIDPEYVQAINNLGVRHMLAARLDQAAECFERSIALDPHSYPAHSNLAHIFILKANFKAAETAARRAIELDGEDPKPAYLLGLSLVMQQKYTPEAVSNLRRSDHLSVRAKLTLGLALAKTGLVADARDTLQTCLKTADGPVREEAKRLLLILR